MFYIESGFQCCFVDITRQPINFMSLTKVKHGRYFNISDQSYDECPTITY